MTTTVGMSDIYTQEAETTLVLELTQQQAEDACFKYIASCGVQFKPRAKVELLSWGDQCSPGSNDNVRFRAIIAGTESPIEEKE